MSYHSQTPSQDRTSDEWLTDSHQQARDLDAAALRHAQAFPAVDLIDLLADFDAVDLQRMLAGIRQGDAAAVGSMMVEAFGAEITRLAAYSVGA